jgi:hypothetical protein
VAGRRRAAGGAQSGRFTEWGQESGDYFGEFQTHSEGSEPMTDWLGVKSLFWSSEAADSHRESAVLTVKGFREASMSSVLGSRANRGRDRQTGTGI